MLKDIRQIKIIVMLLWLYNVKKIRLSMKNPQYHFADWDDNFGGPLSCSLLSHLWEMIETGTDYKQDWVSYNKKIMMLISACWGSVKDIEKAIMASDIGITPSNDGNMIRLVFPELTGERRQELVKDIKKKAEASKVAIRNIRRDAMDQLKKMNKASEITEDDLKDGEERTQKLTDTYIKNIDQTTEKKAKEITTV